MDDQLEAAKVERLVDQLSDADAVVREKAREELIQLGNSDVTRALVHAMIDPRRQLRWEAAKALQAIADPVAAPALMHALDDEDADVRWVAGEGLIALQEVGVKTVLSGLVRRAGSVAFCKSSHHVLQALKNIDGAAPVLKALEESTPAFAVPLTAYRALAALSEPPAT